MTIKVTQLKDPSFLSKLGAEYICTGFMFDKDLQIESIESQLSKEGYIPGIDIAEADKAKALALMEAGGAEGTEEEMDKYTAAATEWVKKHSGFAMGKDY